MTCNIDYDLLNDYAENSLDELTALILGEHIKTCRECSETVKEIQALDILLSGIGFEDIGYPEELKDIKFEIFSKLKTRKGVLLNIRLLNSKIALQREKMNSYVNTYPGVKTGRKAVTLVSDELLKGISFLSARAVKSGYRALLKKRYT